MITDRTQEFFHTDSNLASPENDGKSVSEDAISFEANRQKSEKGYYGSQLRKRRSLVLHLLQIRMKQRPPPFPRGGSIAVAGIVDLGPRSATADVRTTALIRCNFSPGLLFSRCFAPRCDPGIASVLQIAKRAIEDAAAMQYFDGRCRSHFTSLNLSSRTRGGRGRSSKRIPRFAS